MYLQHDGTVARLEVSNVMENLVLLVQYQEYQSSLSLILCRWRVPDFPSCSKKISSTYSIVGFFNFFIATQNHWLSLDYKIIITKITGCR